MLLEHLKSIRGQVDAIIYKMSIQLTDLPNEVLLEIVSHLSQEERLSLFEALKAKGPKQLKLLGLHYYSLYDRFCVNMRTCLYRLVDRCLFMSNQSMIFADWSAFEGDPQRKPLGFISWSEVAPHARLDLHHDTLHHLALKKVSLCCSYVRLTSHEITFSKWKTNGDHGFIRLLIDNTKCYVRWMPHTVVEFRDL